MNFNSEEKEILKKLIEYDFDKLKLISLFLSEQILIDKDMRLLISTGEKYMNFLFFKDGNGKEAVKYLVMLNSLFNKLVNAGMVTLFPVEHPGNIDLLGTSEILSPIKENDGTKNMVFCNNEYIREGDCYWCDKNDNILFQCIQFKESDLPFWNLVHSYPVISEDLVEFVKHNFKTTEQRSLFWTRIAAVASFGAFLASIIIPHACSTRINSEQYNGFMKSDTTTRQEIVTKLDAIDESTHQIFNAKTDTIIK